MNFRNSTIDIDGVTIAAKNFHRKGYYLATDMPMRTVAAVAKTID